jgi:transposase-like protein
LTTLRCGDNLQALGGPVEETLNGLMDVEADHLCGTKRCDSRTGHYKRGLYTQTDSVELKIPKLRTIPFETQIIERYQWEESSIEEALVDEMYLSGGSVRWVEKISTVTS